MGVRGTRNPLRRCGKVRLTPSPHPPRPGPLHSSLLRGSTCHAAGRMFAHPAQHRPCPRHAGCCRCATASVPLHSTFDVVSLRPAPYVGTEGNFMSGGGGRIGGRHSSPVGLTVEDAGNRRTSSGAVAREAAPGGHTWAAERERFPRPGEAPPKQDPRPRCIFPPHDVSLRPDVRSGTEGNGIDSGTERNGGRRAGVAAGMTRAGAAPCCASEHRARGVTDASAEQAGVQRTREGSLRAGGQPAFAGSAAADSFFLLHASARGRHDTVATA